MWCYAATSVLAKYTYVLVMLQAHLYNIKEDPTTRRLQREREYESRHCGFWLQRIQQPQDYRVVREDLNELNLGLLLYGSLAALSWVILNCLTQRLLRAISTSSRSSV